MTAGALEQLNRAITVCLCDVVVRFFRGFGQSVAESVPARFRVEYFVSLHAVPPIPLIP